MCSLRPAVGRCTFLVPERATDQNCELNSFGQHVGTDGYGWLTFIICWDVLVGSPDVVCNALVTNLVTTKRHNGYASRDDQKLDVVVGHVAAHIG